MPELPEVETIRRVLEPALQGRVVQSAEAARPEVVAHPDAGGFCRLLAGRQIVSLARRGQGIPEHAFPSGLRPPRGALPALQNCACLCVSRRQKQRILP